MFFTMLKTWTLIGTIYVNGHLNESQIILTGIQSKEECARVASRIEVRRYACAEVYTAVYTIPTPSK